MYEPDFDSKATLTLCSPALCFLDILRHYTQMVWSVYSRNLLPVYIILHSINCTIILDVVKGGLVYCVVVENVTFVLFFRDRINGCCFLLFWHVCGLVWMRVVIWQVNTGLLLQMRLKTRNLVLYTKFSGIVCNFASIKNLVLHNKSPGKNNRHRLVIWDSMDYM